MKKNRKHPNVAITQLLTLLAVLLATIGEGPCRALADQETSAPNSASELVAAIKRFEDGVVEKRLSNGLLVLFYKRGIAPVFSGAVGVRVGGSDEPAGSTGIAHMLEHMAFKGTHSVGASDPKREAELLAHLEALVDLTTGQPRDQADWDRTLAELQKLWGDELFTREYEKRGSVGLNATTGTDLTQYFVTLPSTAFEFWCWAESERVLNPVMRQFYQERDVVLEERRMRYENDPGGKLYETLIANSFDVHPYKHPVIGYPEDIQRLTAERTAAFQKRYYSARNMAVALVGDVDPERDLQMLERYFGRIPSGSDIQRPSHSEPPLGRERTVKVDFDASPEVLVGYRKPVYPDEKDAPLSVLFEILTGSSVSPVYEELVKKLRVATSVDYFEGPGSAYPNLVIFSISPRAPHTNRQALREFDRVIGEVRKAGVSQEQIEIARRGIAASFIGQLKSNQSIALQLISTQLIYGDWKEMIKWFQLVNAVTPEQVKEVANQYLIDSNRVVAFLESSK